MPACSEKGVPGAQRDKAGDGAQKGGWGLVPKGSRCGSNTRRLCPAGHWEPGWGEVGQVCAPERMQLVSTKPEPGLLWC